MHVLNFRGKEFLRRSWGKSSWGLLNECSEQRNFIETKRLMSWISTVGPVEKFDITICYRHQRRSSWWSRRCSSGLNHESSRFSHRESSKVRNRGRRRQGSAIGSASEGTSDMTSDSLSNVVAVDEEAEVEDDATFALALILAALVLADFCCSKSITRLAMMSAMSYRVGRFPTW